MGGEAAHARPIVRAGVRRRPGTSDVDRDDRSRAAAMVCEHPLGGHRPRVGKSHRVEQRPVLGQARDARAGVARLGLGGDRPHLDVTEAEDAELAVAAQVLVHAGSDTERAGKAQAEGVDGEPWIAHAGSGSERSAGARQMTEEAERADHAQVGGLGVDTAQKQVVEQAVEHRPVIRL